MAYGNDPHTIKSILQTKLTNKNCTETSLNNIIGPLKNLKKDLDNSGNPNLFRSIRKIDERDINVRFILYL